MLRVSEYNYNWDLEERDRLWSKTVHRKQFSGFGRKPPIVLSESAKFIAFVLPEFYIKVWNTEQNRSHAIFMEHSGWISSFAFASDNRILMSGSYDKTVFLWDLHMKKKITKFNVETYVFSVDIDKTSRFFVAGLSNGNIHLWRKNSDEFEEKVIKAHSSHIVSVSFNLKNEIISVGNDSKIKLWESVNLYEKIQSTANRFKIYSVGSYQNGRFIVIGFADKYYRIYRLKC